MLYNQSLQKLFLVNVNLKERISKSIYFLFTRPSRTKYRRIPIFSQKKDQKFWVRKLTPKSNSFLRVLNSFTTKF